MLMGPSSTLRHINNKPACAHTTIHLLPATCSETPRKITAAVGGLNGCPTSNMKPTSPPLLQYGGRGDTTTTAKPQQNWTDTDVSGNTIQPNNILLRTHGKSLSPDVHHNPHLQAPYRSIWRRQQKRLFLRKSRRTLLPAAFNSPTFELLEDSPRRRVQGVSFDSIKSIHVWIPTCCIIHHSSHRNHFGSRDQRDAWHWTSVTHLPSTPRCISWQISEIKWLRILRFMLILLAGSLAH